MKPGKVSRSAGLGIALAAALSYGACNQNNAKRTDMPEYVKEAVEALSEYERVRLDPQLQENWVRKTLADNGNIDFFSNIIIVTPDNAAEYPEYSAGKERVEQGATYAATVFPGRPVDVGKENSPKSRLYVPTEAFVRETEENLVAQIGCHEGNHGKVYKNGFDFVDMSYFRTDSSFHLDMFDTVAELEGNLKQMECPMTQTRMEETRRHYMTYYVELWAHKIEDSKLETTQDIRERYFLPWMKTASSIWVYEEGPNKNVKYGGDRAFPFFICEKKCYVQFELRGRNPMTFRLELPPRIAQN